MGLSFIGNPCEPDEWGDSDIEITGVEEWLTIPNNVTVNPTDTSEEEDSWPEIDDNEDEDFNPDDENLEHEDLVEEFVNYFGYDEPEEYSFHSTDDEDDEDIDYVTYSSLELSPIHSASSEVSRTTDAVVGSQDDADSD